MPVAQLTLEIRIEHAQSLKDRRQVVRSLKDQIRQGFNVSVAEMDEAVTWQSATIGVVAISRSRDYLHGLIEEVERAARRMTQRTRRGAGRRLLGLYRELKGHEVLSVVKKRPSVFQRQPERLQAALFLPIVSRSSSAARHRPFMNDHP